MNLSVDAETTTELTSTDDSTEILGTTNNAVSKSVSRDDRYCVKRKTSGESEIEVLREVKRMKLDINDGLPGLKGYGLSKGWGDVSFTGKTTVHGHKIYQLKNSGLRVILLPPAVKKRILEESRRRVHR